MPVKKTKSLKIDLREKELEQIMQLKEMVFSLKEDSISLENDLSETRTLLFIQMCVILALFGLALGMLFKLL